jgi:hypothetical protein
MQTRQKERSTSSGYSFATMLVNRTAPDSKMNTISRPRRFPCLTASWVSRLSLNFPTSNPNTMAKM